MISQAVILAAGKGTRLLPITETIPKAMVLVNGKPMIQIIIEQLKETGVRDIVIVTHYQKDKIEQFLQDGSLFGVSIRYVLQKEMKGTADALVSAEALISGGRFICLACDSLFETSLLARLLAHEAEGVVTCKPVDDARRYGVIVPDGKRVKQLLEKPEIPPSNLANFSVYVFSRSIFAACRRLSPGLKEEYLLTDAVQDLIHKGIGFGYVTSEHILDVGTLEQLEEAQHLAKRLGL
ncbi:nucleotidyltransferase family protein [Candidatus Woesearchaeota archaeon]|nr:nucleotidyltransferase family protein [Candidatus Woesearchaeota archaeon]